MALDSFLTPADLALFQNTVAQSDPYGIAAKSLMSWQPDYSHLGPVESGITAFGKSFLAGLLHNYGMQQNAEQLSAVVNVLPQLRADPFSVATPEGVDSSAFNMLRGTQMLKNAASETTKGETTDKMLNETLLKLFDKGVETYQIDPNKALSAVVEAKKTGDLSGISELLQSTVGTTPPPAAVTAAAPSVAAALPTTTTAAPPLPTGQVVAPVVEKTREQLYQELLPQYRGDKGATDKAVEEALNAQKLASADPILSAISAKVPKEFQDEAIKESGLIKNLNNSFTRIDELFKKGEEKFGVTALLPEVLGLNTEWSGKIGIPIPTTESAKDVQSINAEIESIVSTVLKGTGNTQEADYKRKIQPLLPAYLDSPETRATKIEALKNMMLEGVRTTKGGTPFLEQFGIAKLPEATAPIIPNTPTVGSEIKNRLMSVLGGDLPEVASETKSLDTAPLSQNYDFMGQMFKPQSMAQAEQLGKEGPLPVQAAMEQAVKTNMQDHGMNETEAKLRVFEDMKNGNLNMDKSKIEQLDKAATIEATPAAPLIEAVVWQESKGESDAVSPKGATGIMQIMPETGKEIAKELGYEKYDLKDPTTNRVFGEYYLNKMLKQFGSEPMALAAYNAGPGKVREWIDLWGNDWSVISHELQKRGWYKETTDYVPSILKRKNKLMSV